MNNKEKILVWTPRILTIAFALFLSLFAMDVFDGKYDFWNTVLAFVMHLLPTFLILIMFFVSLKWELVGTIVYFILGVFYIAFAWGKMHISAYIFISGPLFLISVLYYFSWRTRKKNKHELKQV